MEQSSNGEQPVQETGKQNKHWQVGKIFFLNQNRNLTSDWNQETLICASQL